jgi:GTP cyclohydrolase I
MTKLNLDILPDPAKDKHAHAAHYSPLSAVGMSKIEVPILIKDQDGVNFRVPASAEAFVSLINPESRGIHMSRLYTLVQEGLTQAELSFELMNKTLQEFLKSHEGLSDSAELSVAFSAPVRRKSLKSANAGWRTYPVQFGVNQSLAWMEVLVTYSSTCPASAARARQLIQQNFDRSFTEDNVSKAQIMNWLGSVEGINATPHAQRSYAKVRVEFSPDQSDVKKFNYEQLIDMIEDALGTPVQTAVKREDEQEFALKNGQNLMFCEDAARRVQAGLETLTFLTGYQGEFRHVESLHPHDAVAKIKKV